MESHLDKYKVLIVDDVSSARKNIIVLLRQMGLKNVVEAKSSSEALSKLELESFQLVISDWEMPDVSGLELFNRVKKNSAYKGIPFFLITSSSEKEKVIEAIKAGVSDYAIKPVSFEVLYDKIIKRFPGVKSKREV